VDLRQIHLGFGNFSSIGQQVQAMGRLVERGTMIAYSPLREGILTGRFHDDRRSVAALPRLRG
jgi:hypothetical protein